MTIGVLEIHHHAIRVDADQPKLDAVQNFYERMLGLDVDPGRPTVADIRATKAELDRLGAVYWSMSGINGLEAEQVFVNDPCGNMIELHQIDQCRCRAANRPG